MNIRVRSVRFLLGCVLFACLALNACGRAVPIRPVPREDTPRIVILSAFDAELNQLVHAAEITDRVVVNGRTVVIGKLEGQDVLLATSGVSMVNAAMMTQALLDTYTVRAVVMTGIAGGVNPDLHIGDVTVPAQWGQYQEQVFARETSQGWDTGLYGQPFGHYEMMFPQPVEVVPSGNPPDRAEKHFWFVVDPGMLEAARLAAQTVVLKNCLIPTQCLDPAPRVVVGGNGVSGQAFVDNADYRTWVWQTFQADALDMETAAVAQVAYVHGTPFLAFRSLSDLAGGGGGKNELVVFMGLAAENSTRVVTAFLQTWKP